MEGREEAKEAERSWQECVGDQAGQENSATNDVCSLFTVIISGTFKP